MKPSSDSALRDASSDSARARISLVASKALLAEAAESEADAQIALKAQLDPQLKQWSEDHGKKKNIRALLAGMDQVACCVHCPRDCACSMA